MRPITNVPCARLCPFLPLWTPSGGKCLITLFYIEANQFEEAEVWVHHYDSLMPILKDRYLETPQLYEYNLEQKALLHAQISQGLGRDAEAARYYEASHISNQTIALDRKIEGARYLMAARR